MLLFAKYNWGDEVRENEIGRECSTNMVNRIAYRMMLESQKERDHWEDQDVVDL
jgi:hypothetical protein